MSNLDIVNGILSGAASQLAALLDNSQQAPVPVPAPAPDPVPVPSVSSAVTTTPTQLENMELQGAYYVAVSPFPQKNACLHFDIKGLGYKKKLHVEFVRSLTATGKGNEKTYRMWNGGVGGRPDFYFGTPDGSWVFGFFEYVSNANYHLSAQLPPMDGRDHKESIDFVFPSGQGRADGSIVYKVDGNIIAVATNVQMDDNAVSAVYNWHCIQFDTPNWDPSNSSMKVRADSIVYLVS